MERVFFSDPAGVCIYSNEQQVEQSYEAEHQADEEKLSEGRSQKPRKNLGWQAEVPWRWEKAWKADPVQR